MVPIVAYAGSISGGGAGRRGGPLTQQEEIDARVRDRYRGLPVEAALLSLGLPRVRDLRHQGMELPHLDDLEQLPALSQLLAAPVLPTTGQAGWLMNAQRAPAGAYNASVALESQLQNRGLVASQRALQAAWAPSSSSSHSVRPAAALAAPNDAAAAAPSPAATDLGPSPHAAWTRAYQPGNSLAFNQAVGARARQQYE